MLSIATETKYALYDGEEQVTDFIWTSCHEKGNYVFLYNKDKYKLVIYDKIAGERTLSIEQVEDFKIDQYIKILKDEYWGLYDFSGKELLPIKYDYIGEYIYSSTTNELMAVQADVDYESGGYHILSKKAYYDVEKINITKTNRIELYKDGEWFMLE